MRRSLTRSERIRKKADFDDVFNHGIRLANDGIKLLVKKNRLQINRVVVIIKKGMKSISLKAFIKRKSIIHNLNCHTFHPTMQLHIGYLYCRSVSFIPKMLFALLVLISFREFMSISCIT